MLTLVVSFLSPQIGWTQPQNLSETEKPFALPPTFLGVGTVDSKQFPLSRDISENLKLNGLGDFLTEDGLNWAPAEALKTFRLTARIPIPERGEQPHCLRVGQPGDPDIDLEVKFPPESITEKDPVVRMTFTIVRPERIPIGVFAGDLRLRFTNPKLEPKEGFELSWPVVIYVAGRALEDVRFLEPVVRVGAPASVIVTVLSIGPHLGVGTGNLRLNYQPLMAVPPQPGVRLPLPLPDMEPIVPRYDPRFGPASVAPAAEDGETAVATVVDQTVKWWAHGLWRDEALWQRVTTEPVNPADFAIPANLVNRHQLEVHLPDCFSLGDLKAEVDWDAGRKADAATPARLSKPATAKIGSGLRIEHRVGWIGDRFKLRAVTAKPLGERLTAVVTYPDQQTTTNVTLNRVVPKGDGELSDDLTTYSGEFPERQLNGGKVNQSGVYSAQIIELEGGAGDTLHSPTTFRICFQLDTRPLQQHPELTIFASPIPLDVYFWRTPFSGSPWRTSHEKAVGMAFSGEQLVAARVRRLPIYRVIHSSGHSSRQVITDPQAEVEVSISPVGVAENDGVVNLPANKSLSWDISAAISPKDPLDAPRRQLGASYYEQRFLLIGQDAEGKYHTRVWWLPVRVRIDRDWEHHKYFVISLAVMGVVLVAGIGVWLRSRLSSSAVRSAAEASVPVTATDDFFGDTPRSSPVSTAPTSSAAPMPPPPPKPDDDWFNA
ncbi:MAG: hypothetical protein NTZ32_01055 [Planctomycetales bacterium]|nr:hypothetical protein [Planctomycetales bacterium]